MYLSRDPPPHGSPLCSMCRMTKPPATCPRPSAPRSSSRTGAARTATTRAGRAMVSPVLGMEAGGGVAALSGGLSLLDMYSGQPGPSSMVEWAVLLPHSLDNRIKPQTLQAGCSIGQRDWFAMPGRLAFHPSSNSAPNPFIRALQPQTTTRWRLMTRFGCPRATSTGSTAARALTRRRAS